MMGRHSKKSKPVTKLKLFHLFLVELKVVYRNKQGMQYYGDGSKPIEPSQLWGEQKDRMAA